MAVPLVTIVDDEASVREALGRLLSLSGFEVRTFPSGQAFLQSQPMPDCPGCLLLDYHMGGLSGLEVLRKLQQAGIRLPVIILTAHDRPALRDQCLAAGAVAYLTKPLQHAPLLDAIAQALQRGEPVSSFPPRFRQGS